MTQSPRVWADVELDRLRGNLAALRDCLPARTGILGVIKADAYGHGAVMVAETLAAEGVEQFGVAAVDEAIELREAGFRQPIWHLGVATPDQMEAVVVAGLVPTVTCLEQVEALERVAPAGYPVQLKLDTGMGRRGGAAAETEALWRRIAAGPLTVEGVATHLATADTDAAFATAQIERFVQFRLRMEESGLRACCWHAANSAGILRFGACGGNLVRPGYALYAPLSAPLPGVERFLPVLSLATRLVQVRRLPAGHEVGYAHGCRLPGSTTVGLAAIGYGDGLPWQLSNGAEAVVRGRRVPYLGRVNMDLIQLDLNSVPEARVGDCVTIIGVDGDAEVTVAELAGWAGCSEYAICTQLSRRVVRRYLDRGRPVAERAFDGRLARRALKESDV